MFYTIKHLTQFRYSAAVSESLLEARMQPRTEGVQRCLFFNMQTNPKAQVLEYGEHLGNVVHHFNIPRRHSQLGLQAQSIVEMEPFPFVPEKISETVWLDLDAAIRDGDFWEFLVPSQFTEPTELLRALAKELKVERRSDPLSFVRELNTKLHESIAYSPQITKADSQLDEALSKRKGVCQDFAHILIALLREVNLPARYVSGYLYRAATDKRAHNEGATHAWVEVYFPGLEWIGFDPSNNVVAREDHIRVALGRDYGDLPPTKGIFKGEASSEVRVKVEVERHSEPPRPVIEAVPLLDPLDLEGKLPEENTIDNILQSYRAHQLQQQQ
jgi:transglutaminase-like putative cysteine protease